jgi:hypothetical protein
VESKPGATIQQPPSKGAHLPGLALGFVTLLLNTVAAASFDKPEASGIIVIALAGVKKKQTTLLGKGIGPAGAFEQKPTVWSVMISA